MTDENQQVNVVEILRITGENTKEFMSRVADHIEQLENTVIQLNQKIADLEKNNEA